MTDLATRLEAASEGSRELSDEVLLALGYEVDSAATWWRLPKETHFRSGERPHPAASVDDGLALAGDDWEALLEEAFCRCSDSYESGGGAPLKALPLFISAALVRAAK